MEFLSGIENSCQNRGTNTAGVTGAPVVQTRGSFDSTVDLSMSSGLMQVHPKRTKAGTLMTTVLSDRHGGQGKVDDLSSIPRKSRLWQTLSPRTGEAEPGRCSGLTG